MEEKILGFIHFYFYLMIDAQTASETLCVKKKEGIQKLHNKTLHSQAFRLTQPTSEHVFYTVDI